jgi:NAD(P)-dependent dehydrogenase (short-subunit alcohol dehydrogenase family)
MYHYLIVFDRSKKYIFIDDLEILTMKRILITGSNSGIGLEFTKKYLEKGDYVIASCRKPESAYELRDIRENHAGRIIVPQLDVSDEDSRDKLFKNVSSFLDKLDVLINNAGVISGNLEHSPPLGELHNEDMTKVFLINSISPVYMAEKFLPLLKRSNNPKIINISSISGSISKRTRGGGYSYSASKAALNMFTKNLSNDLREDRIIVVAIHPGWVKTGFPYTENAPNMPEETVGGMMDVIESLEMKDSGKFIDWQGTEQPW